MSQPPVEHERNGDRGRYLIRLEDGQEAEMTYRLRDPDVRVIDHTFVPPVHRGGGVAERLVRAAVAEARREGWHIAPVCPYVVAQFRRHPEWNDLLAE